jgi:hypothetical protein
MIKEGYIKDNMKRFFRSNSCRIDNYNFPLEFVPKLKPKLHGSIPSPMNLGLKCNKNNIKLDKLKLDDILEYNTDVEAYYNKTKDELNLGPFNRSNRKFKTNKNLLESVKESLDQKQNYSKSPPKKISIRALKMVELNLDEGEIEFLGTKSISTSPKKSSILTHLERKISTAEEYFFKNN